MSNKIIVVVLGIISTSAFAQYCPPVPIPGVCNPALQGNPLDTRNGVSFDTTRDFTVRTSLWDFAFVRRFISSPRAWGEWGASVGQPLIGVPAPFGAGPDGTGLRMWHSLYSLAVVGTGGSLAVRDLDGYQTEFSVCTPAATLGARCWTSAFFLNPATKARLRMETTQVSPTVVAPSLIQPDGLVLNYQRNRPVSGATGPLFFLSSIAKIQTSATGETPVLAVTYFGDSETVSLPPAFTASACPAGGPFIGVPFIKEVSFHAGANQKLHFYYGNEGTGVGQQCVLKKVVHVAANGTDTNLVVYTYSTNAAGYPELATRSNVASGAVTEAYDYSSGFGRYAFAGGQGLITQKTLSSYKITSSTGGGLSRDSVATGTSSTTCAVLGSDTCCRSDDAAVQTQINLKGSAGDGSGPDGGAAGFSSTYYSMTGVGITHDMVLYRKEDVHWIGPGGASSPGLEDWIWRDAKGGASCNPSLGGPAGGSWSPGVVWAHKNKRGAYTVTPHAFVYPGTASAPTAVERTALLLGASDRDGTGARQTETYTYSYGVNGAQRQSTVSQRSVIATDAGVATATTAYDGDRVASITRLGHTKNISGVTQLKTFGTFHKTARSCRVAGSDLLSRTVRIEGPCEVNVAGTGCLGPGYPVTELEYALGTAIDNTSGRLVTVWRFPDNSTSGCGNALTTTYAGYSPEGMPSTVVEESGATRVFAYSGALVTSMAVGSAAPVVMSTPTLYEYQGSKLTKTTYPLGNYERICYQSGASSACSGGTLTDKPQWRAKYDSAGTWTERIDYEYGQFDGNLVRETFSRNTGATSEVRLSKTYDRDAHQRLTFEQSGSGSVPSMQTRSAFDGADNRIATSIPFAHTGTTTPVYAPAFCASNSALCRWMEYDRADRLVQMDAHPNGISDSASQRTCIEYDRQGNVRRAAAGCSTGTACPSNPTDLDTPSATPCTQAYVDYEVDDFGNTTAVISPGTGSTSIRATTRYEYDARGNVVKKQTRQMLETGATVESSYDQIGRVLLVRQMPSTQPLFSFGYDADEAVESGCIVPMTYGNGRMTVRDDSFGKTWYDYDKYGNVIGEIRRRAGYPVGCLTGAGKLERNPHTYFTYNDNGALTSIVYPHERTVNYVYPTTSGAMDRPSSITNTLWTGSIWGSTPSTLIDNINWEPYGELRAYRFNSTGQWVEYLRQGTLETPPGTTTCSALPANTWGPTDGSGRLRGVFVSDGTFALGTPNGNILKQVYTWRSDQLIEQQTCHRNLGSPNIETLGYDLLPQLTSKSESMTSVATTSVAYAYDARSNRTVTNLTGPFTCNQGAFWYSAAWQLDLPYSVMWGPGWGSNSTTCNTTNPSSGKYNYQYDLDGRRTATWDETTIYGVHTNYDQSVVDPAIDSVFKTATLYGSGTLGGTFSYYYDAFGRRRAKTTPWSTTDEYFYDLGHQMLSDRGSNNIGSSATEFPEDDYIWLGGRPVAFIRSKFSASGWNRTADGFTNWCTRDGETGNLGTPCGTFMLVTDSLGKPLATFDRGGTAGIASYEGFGFLNRRAWRFGTPHYQATVSPPLTITTIAPPIPPGFDGPLRIMMSRSKYGSSSTLALAGASQTVLQGDRAHAWSD